VPSFLRRWFPVRTVLRCCPFARFGAARALPRVIMDPSDSQLSERQLSSSLSWPSRLAPVVGAAGVHWVSRVPSNVFGTCHALRPRQVSGNLTRTAGGGHCNLDKAAAVFMLAAATVGWREARRLYRIGARAEGGRPGCGARVLACRGCRDRGQ
jgi:hypothetical protein